MSLSSVVKLHFLPIRGKILLLLAVFVLSLGLLTFLFILSYNSMETQSNELSDQHLPALSTFLKTYQLLSDDLSTIFRSFYTASVDDDIYLKQLKARSSKIALELA